LESQEKTRQKARALCDSRWDDVLLHAAGCQEEPWTPSRPANSQECTQGRGFRRSPPACVLRRPRRRWPKSCLLDLVSNHHPIHITGQGSAALYLVSAWVRERSHRIHTKTSPP